MRVNNLETSVVNDPHQRGSPGRRLPERNEGITGWLKRWRPIGASQGGAKATGGRWPIVQRNAALKLLLALAAVSGGTAVQAQDPPPVISPLRADTDHNGVNLLTGKIRMEVPVLSVPAAPNLRFDRVQNAAPYISGQGKSSGGGEVTYPEMNYSIHSGRGSSESFHCLDDVCESLTGTGSAFTPGVNLYQEAGSGARYHFNLKHVDTKGSSTRSLVYYASAAHYPNGESITYEYDTATYAGDARVWYRPVRISSNLGYFITLSYRGNDLTTNEWSQVSQATLYASAAPSTPLGQLTYGTDGSITDLGGRVYYCQGCTNQLGVNLEASSGSMRLPGETTSSLQAVARSDAPLVASVTIDGVTWNYGYTNLRYDSYSQDWLYDRITVTGPNGYSQAYDFTVRGPAASKQNVMTRSTDSLARSTSYSFDDAFRLVGMTLPEGNGASIAYDARGNVSSKTTNPKPNTGLTNIVETAYVDTINCQGVLCYRPVWIRDGLNRQTDFFYNDKGQLTEQTDPADADGVRRKTYIAYEATTGVSRKDVVRVCGTGAACGTANETRTEYDYWGNTLLPSVERKIDAARGITLTTSYSYDAAGRLLSADGPLAGSDDAVYSRYDVHGRKTWEIGPKGANGLRAAKRFTYRDSDDKVIAVEEGTVPDPASTTLTVLTRVDTSYDSRRNPVREAVSAGGTTYSLVQRTFQDIGRLECEARRMNPAAFGSLPASACSLGAQGNDGADRITRNVYDAAGQLLQIQKAYGTPVQQDYATYTYTPNGKQKNVTDANGNKAELRYDGHDRQVRWVFPSKSTAGALNEADYEAYTWDAAGNRTSLRKRDGSLITYAYDALNRVTVKNVPASASGAAGYSVHYGYDAGNRQTYARFGSASGYGITNSYDALGRLSATTNTTGGTSRTLSYLYDAGSRRTRVTHPDGAGVDYGWDASDRTTFVGIQGNGWLALSHYNSQGQLRLYERPIGSTTYGYDEIGRPSWAWNSFASAPAYNNEFRYYWNPASQITTLQRSNDAYAWTGAYDVSRGYSVNGLNQYSATTSNGSPSATFSYDANGNLTSDGSTSFVYDAENRLVSASGAKTASLSYDPLGRLFQVSGGAAGVTQFLYDGDELVAEYNSSGTLLRRYVHGAGVDDPIAWFEGPVASDSARRFLHADHQGSIIAVTDAAGSMLAVNSYDEWGIPSAGNIGRFQYTGQAWLAELGMYHYKARIYSPTLGRFLQTDPIGYDDQMNLYAYVGNDPVNALDPSGLACVDVDATECVDLAESNGSDFMASAENDEAAIGAERENRTYTRDENGFIIKGSKVTPNGQNANTKETNQLEMVVPEDADAFGHSHDSSADPNGTDVQIGRNTYERADTLNPGPKDIDAAVAIGKPLYIQHDGRTGVIERTSGVVHFRVVKGKMTKTERRITTERGRRF